MKRTAQIPTPPSDDTLAVAQLGGTRSEAVNRLQLGVSGLVGILLLVGLASIIENRAKQVERDSVPEAVATVEPSPSPSKPDPLAEAGVVPELPASPTPSATPAPALMPERGITRPASPPTPAS